MLEELERFRYGLGVVHSWPYVYVFWKDTRKEPSQTLIEYTRLPRNRFNVSNQEHQKSIFKAVSRGYVCIVHIHGAMDAISSKNPYNAIIALSAYAGARASSAFNINTNRTIATTETSTSCPLQELLLVYDVKFSIP